MFRSIFLIFLLACLAPLPAEELIVRPAPDFELPAHLGNGAKLSNTFTGQPVVLIVAAGPSARAFKKQVKLIEPLYRYFAARDVVFLAAFTKSSGRVNSDIPFVVLPSGNLVGNRYGISGGKHAVAIISPGRNLDAFTQNILSAEAVLSILDNNYARRKREILAKERAR